MSAPLRFFKKIMDAKATINTLSDEIKISELQGVKELAYYIVFGAGTSAGAIQAESAHLSDYTGTWAAEGSPVAWVAATRVHVLRITGISYVARVRISTGIVAGTVDVYALGN